MQSVPATFGLLALCVPDGWVDRSLLTFSEKDTNGFAHNITVTRQPTAKGQTFSAFCEEQIGLLAQNLRGFCVLEREALLIRGREALRLLSGWRGPADTAIRQMHYFIAGAEQGVIITGTALETTIEDCREPFARVALSLQIG